MKAQLKCSNCGAEISNLNFSWGRKQWLWFIPFMIFVFLFPILMEKTILKKDTSNFRTDLVIKDTEKRYTNGTIEILGKIENHGKVNWENIVVKAELFGKDNNFLDEISGRIATNILPGGTDYFKLSSKDFPEARWQAINDVKIKVADAYHSKY
jgi:hypothetical protein